MWREVLLIVLCVPCVSYVKKQSSAEQVKLMKDDTYSKVAEAVCICCQLKVSKWSRSVSKNICVTHVGQSVRTSASRTETLESQNLRINWTKTFSTLDGTVMLWGMIGGGRTKDSSTDVVQKQKLSDHQDNWSSEEWHMSVYYRVPLILCLLVSGIPVM